MAEPVLLGVDIGTYEAKATLTTVGGRRVDASRRPHDVRTPHPGWVEHDPEQVWWQGLTAVVGQLLARLDTRRHRVAGLAVSGIGPCVLPVDEQLRPLRAAILYGVDTRAAAEVEALTERIGDTHVFARCGNALSSQSAGPKVAWVARHEPHVAAATAHYLTCHSYLVARLTGRVRLDHLTASYFHPFYDIRAQAWRVDDLEDVVRPGQLPELRWSAELAGHVTAAAASETGLPVGTPVAVGTADAPAEALAAGVRSSGDLMVMYGSSGFLIAPAEHPRPHPGVYTAAGLWPGSWLHAAGTSTAGTAVRWALGLAGLEPSAHGFGELVALAQHSPPGARGLLFLPHLAGERTPVDDPAARGAVVGLGLEHGREDLARAVVEGVAHAQAWALHTLAATAAVTRVAAIGGGTANPVWTQALSDITGLAQQVVTSPGASAGDCYLAAVAAGLVAADDTAAGWAPEIAATVHPRPELHARYAEDQHRYRQLYAALAQLRTGTS